MREKQEEKEKLMKDLKKKKRKGNLDEEQLKQKQELELLTIDMNADPQSEGRKKGYNLNSLLLSKEGKS